MCKQLNEFSRLDRVSDALAANRRAKTVFITNAYFAPDRKFVDLLTAAARRRVDVRILTAGPRTDVTAWPCCHWNVA